MNSYRNSFLDSIPPVVKNLIFINIILWLASIVLPGFFNRWNIELDLNDILGMHYWDADKFKLSQLITYMFMHANLSHIFFNMFALYMFGSALENYWGSQRFLIYYLITGIGAGIIQQIFWTIEFQSFISEINSAITTDILNSAALIEHKASQLNLPITIGASGSVFGLLLAFGWLFPEVRLMMLFIPVPIKARVFVILYGVAELFLGIANFSGDSVAHFAHLGGMLFGVILILLWKKKRY